MRWSGRIDCPSTCQPRCNTSSVSIMPNGALASSSRSRPTCRRVGRYATNRTPCRSASTVCFTAPRFGQIEEHAIEIALVDTFVDITYVHGERNVVAEKAVHVAKSAGREVVANLIAR